MWLKKSNLFFILLILIGCKNTSEINTSDKKEKEVLQNSGIGRVIGIGGIFFKCNNPKEIKAWYGNNLGIETDAYGSMFEFRKSDSPEEKAYLQWSPFSANTKYFQPSVKEFMINYRVVNLENLLDSLKVKGVTILDSIESYEYGKFIHILDPEGNKIELWEPVDSVFTKLYKGKTTR